MSTYPKSIIVFIATGLLFAKPCLAQQKPSSFNRDSLKTISKTEFDHLVESSISLLQTKDLSEISDSAHIAIMMCLNTIFMAHDSTFQRRFTVGIYETLERISQEKRYVKDIIKIYPEWVPNRGMGFYFPKLQMELYGTPLLYAWFQVGK